MSFVFTSTFELRFGTAERFEQSMTRIVPAMAGQGWRLICATRSITGTLPTVMHVWEIPSLESMSEAPAAAFAADESLMSEVGVLAEVILKERLELMSPTAYDPSVAS